MTTKQIEELREAMIAVEDFINEPRRGRDDHPDVTDYRHEAYRIWSPLRDMISATLTERSQTEEGAREVLQSAKPGWVMVPREPTEAMIEAARDSVNPIGCCLMDDIDAAIVFRAMLSASPDTPPDPESAG
jgi:hypothetical protein